MRLRSQPVHAVAFCGLLAATPACAQAPAVETIAPHLEIVRFAVDGNTLLPPEEVERAVAPYVGKQKDFGDIQRALESLEQVYRARGYGVVQVLLPEQDITRGVIRLHVKEPRIGKVIIEGNRYFGAANIRASLPALQPGVTPNSLQVARNLQLLSEHPAKQTTVLLKPGATENEVDAAVKVSDEPPLKFVATFDNTGTNEVGRFRASIGMRQSNLFNRDHILNLQYVTSPGNPHNASIYGAGYRMPFYAQSSLLDLVAGYSDVSAGTLPGLFDVSGSGTLLGARYNLYLPKSGEYEQKLGLGLDYRAYRSRVLQPGAAVIPGVTVHPVSVAYSGLWRMTNAEFGFHASYTQNLFPGGTAGADGDFKASRADATANYRVWRAGVNYTRAIAKEWQLRAVLTGQYSEDALVPGEQFGFGGPDSVRGFNIREIANDKGYAASFEIHTPELGARPGWRNMKTRLLAFYDTGTTGRNSLRPGELSGQSGGSAGVGARVTAGKRFSLRLDLAQVVDPAGNRARGDRMLQASAAIPF